MRFRVLAGFFDKIERASSRLKMTDLLADLFKEADSDEIARVVYLCQGQLAPAYKQVEIGFGEKFVEEAISKASGYEKAEVRKLFKKKGDLGLVAEELLGKRKQSSLFSAELTMEKVFRNLMKIASSEGKGSQPLKIKLLAELLNSASPLEARYLIRIPLGSLRLGAGDSTIMDAFAKNLFGEAKKDKKLVKEVRAKLKEKKKEKREEEFERKLRLKIREMVEDKYNVHSDLGSLAEKLKKHGLAGLKRIDIQPGIPIRPSLAERLPTAKEIVEKLGKCAVESKYDGFRCITRLASIYVKGKGLIPIKDVKIGDKILTHKGRFKKVLAKNRRIIERGEKLFRIQTYFGNEFKITEKHPILVERNEKSVWLDVEKLEKNDFLVFPLPKRVNKNKAPKRLDLETLDCYKKTIRLNKDFFRFIGYWIGDGYTNEFHNTERIGLIFNKKTGKKLCDYYEGLVQKLFGLKKTSKNIHNGAIYLYWRDAPFRKWLTENFRREWKGKTLPDWFFDITEKQYAEFLKGWIESDGTEDEKGRISITTKEKDLAMFAQLLGLRFKKIIGIKKFRAGRNNYKWTYYKLIIPKSERKAKIVDNKVLVKILKIEKIKHRDPRTRLFNLQVEKDESYCVPMMSLHNCQIHKNDGEITIFSRRQENITEMFPEIVEAAKKQVRAKEAIFEGEALAFNEETQEYYPFQVTIQRKRKYGIGKMAKEFPLTLFAFDLLYASGKNLMELPFKERRERLKKVIGRGKTIALTDAIVTDSAKKIEQYFNESVEKGLEGIIAKDLKAKYIAGARKFSWIKLKRSYKGELSDTVDTVIIGFFKGRGKRTQFGLGGLLTAVYDKKADSFKSIAKIGTGMSEEMLVDLHKRLSKIKHSGKPKGVDSALEPDVWVNPHYVIEVNADEITLSPVHTAGKQGKKPGFALRFPRLVRVRQDKGPKEATTVKEIASMFRRQRHVKTGE
jgi:ATP-dependent DNA ligase